jgi:hypothetical protein
MCLVCAESQRIRVNKWQMRSRNGGRLTSKSITSIQLLLLSGLPIRPGNSRPQSTAQHSIDSLQHAHQPPYCNKGSACCLVPLLDNTDRHTDAHPGQMSTPKAAGPASMCCLRLCSALLMWLRAGSTTEGGTAGTTDTHKHGRLLDHAAEVGAPATRTAAALD